jgi:hypothetical protein
MSLTEGAQRIRLVYRVGMLWDGLLGLGLLAYLGLLPDLGLTTVHTTVGSPRQCSITTRCALTSHTLTGGLLGVRLTRTEGGDFLAKLGNFGEKGLEIHGLWLVLGSSVGT